MTWRSSSRSSTCPLASVLAESRSRGMDLAERRSEGKGLRTCILLARGKWVRRTKRNTARCRTQGQLPSSRCITLKADIVSPPYALFVTYLSTCTGSQILARFLTKISEPTERREVGEHMRSCQDGRILFSYHDAPKKYDDMISWLRVGNSSRN